MRKVSPGIVWYALISVNIAFLLGACIRPVDVKPFLEDDRVEDIIRGNTGVGVDIGFEEPKDFPPELLKNIGGTMSPLAANGIVTVSLSGSDSVTITVTNAKDYNNDIEWHYDLDCVESGPTFNLDSIRDTFNAVGTYPVTVIGRKTGVLYNTLFYVNVES